MANTLDENGLSLETRNEIVTKLKTAWQNIFGANVNLDSNTSDGQLLQIFAQFCTDFNELSQEIYNSFSPTKVSGTVQDERYAINGIFRKTGSYTIQPITITVNKTVTLNGIDSYSSDGAGAYTIQSDDGQQWYLEDTVIITTADSPKTVPFRAKQKGNVQPTIGTITSQVTVVQGVTSVNNAVAPTSYGSDEGTDYDFMIRRAQSVANASENNCTTIKGNILALDGVNQCEVYQYIETRDVNQQLITDANGVPPYSLWCIVDGGTTADIANIIYSNNSNTMLKGSVSSQVYTASGQYITIKFDRPVAVPLYLRFDLQKTVTGSTFVQSDIKEYIMNNLTYSVGQYAETSRATEVARQALIDLANGNGVPVNMEISTNGSTWVDYIAAASVQNQFVVDSSRITITEL